MNIQRQKKRIMGDFTCSFCYRHYKMKDNYDKHIRCCEFFHRSRREHPDTAYEPVPTIRELYHLVQDLACKNAQLQKKIAQLEKNQTTRNRKNIIEYLDDRLPTSSAFEWARSFVIQQRHLDTIFEGTLTDGIKHCIKDHLQTIDGTLPICAFTQKPNVIYAYNTNDCDDASVTETNWHVMTNAELDKFIFIISYKFLQAFMEWQRDFQHLLKTSIDDEEEETEHTIRQHQINDEIKNQHILYMIKINGGRVNDDKKRADIKQVLFRSNQIQLPGLIEG
jgi:hypothetical protein